MATDFREIEKESFRILVPPRVAEAVRVEALKSRRSLSAITTVALCQAFGIDATRFGLTPIERKTKPPRGAETSVA